MFPREYRGVAFAVGLFVVVQVGALALVPSFEASGYQPVEDPQDPTNSVIYIVAIVVMTGFMLAAFRYELDWAIRLVIIGVSAWLSWYVFAAFVSPILAAVPAIAVGVGLLVYPEWYVIDAAGVLMGAGAAGLFGISFGLLPALVLLTFLAVYDAISVYGTEHMLSLAEGVMDLNIPVVLVIPLSLSYSLLDDDGAAVTDAASDESTHDEDSLTEGVGEPIENAALDGADETDVADDEDGDRHDERSTESDIEGTDANGEHDVDDGRREEAAATESDGRRDVFFIGLGDAVIPAVLVASAARFSPAEPLSVPFFAVNLPAVLAMVGTIVGLLVLLRWVMNGRAHAGLPLLNGGAIGGYLIGSLVAGISLVDALGLGVVV
ncbi:MAG: presenilin family intramembrane aspartyl protease [Halorubrum sp.]